MGNAGKLLATFLVYYAVSCIAPTIPLNAEQQHTAWGEQKPLQVYAHRGGAGMHAESTIGPTGGWAEILIAKYEVE
jgi:hypothetical protein